MQNTDNIEVYEFGEFCLDARNRLLRRGERQIGLALKEFEVLFFLVENAGRVIEKNELHEAIWKDTFVEEGTLTKSISRLRKKLEAGDDEKIIETLPKRGYRFLPRVTRRRIVAPAAPLVVEECAVQRISVEQTIFLPNDSTFADGSPFSTPGRQALNSAPENSKSEIRNSKFIWLGAMAAAAVVFASALFFWRYAAPTPKSLVAANIVPFSGAAGYEDAPAFSPDGKQIVYVWDGDEGGATDVYVRLTAGGEPVRLTATAAGERYPIFSPDGSTVVFVRDFRTHGEVVAIPALGGAERRVCRLFSANFSISLAPDGKSLAVIDSENSNAKEQYAVYLINLETGARRRIAAPGEFRGETTPRFAPDGKSIAFVRVFEDQRHDLFVAAVNASENAVPAEARQITFDEKIIHSLAWSADGAWIYFVSFRGSNRAGLWRVPAGGGAAETVSTSGREITNLAIFADGKTVAFVENALPNLDLWQTAAGDEAKPKKFLASTFNEFYPKFTPDDARVVFASDRSGKKELWTADRTGKNLRQLTKTDFNIGRSAVSPDGLRAAFEVRGDFGGGIFIAEIETGATRQLVASTDSFNFLPAWSGDGRFVYFTSNRTGAEQIWKIAADGGGEPVPITRQGGFEAFPAPDGTLFFRRSKDTNDFGQVSDDGSDNFAERPTPQIAADLGGAPVRLAGNRAGIYFFVEESEDVYEVKFYDFAARQIKPALGKMRLPARILNLLAVSSDGKQFLSTTNNADYSSIMLAALER